MPPLISAFSLSLLAQALPDPKSGEAQTWLFMALVTLFSGFGGISTGLLNLRKLRGNDPSADARYATKSEHNKLAEEVAGNKVQIDRIESTVANELRSINRALGRLEGAAGTTPRHGQG